jgi:acylglycerol lipase
VPSGRVIGGKAWNARKMNPDPSIRIRCVWFDGCGGVSTSAASVVSSVSAGVAGSFVQNIKSRAIRAHHLLVLDPEKHARMPECATATVTGDSSLVDMDNLGRSRNGVALRHACILYGRGTAGMIAMRPVLSTFARITALFGLLLLAACDTQYAPPGPPTEPAGETSDTFVMPDGMQLPYRTWLPQGAPWAVVLALHGMNDSRDAWEIPAPALADAGIAVIAPDQRGFGATATRGHWPGTEALVNDARTMARLVHTRYPKARLFLMGESMGAAVLMCLATEPDPPAADGYVLIAPAVWGRSQMNVFVRGALWLASSLVPGMTATGQSVHVTASDNHAALVRLSTDPLTIRATRFDTVKGLVDLMDAALAAAPRFHAPALFLYGSKDELIPAHATLAAWRALPPNERTAFYQGGYHLLLRDRERGLRIGDVIQWMYDRAAPLPSGADQQAITRLSDEPP